MLHATKSIDGRILWANLHLLFWLSLIPFVTGWIGENHAAPLPTALYGFVLLMSALAWLVLQRTIIRQQGTGSRLRAANLQTCSQLLISLQILLLSVVRTA
jgi:uncharacterized membrane protein